MRGFWKSISLLLFALWLPATLHCQIEAFELSELFSCGDEHTGGSRGHEIPDACTTIESGFVKNDSGFPKLDAPVWQADLLATFATSMPSLLSPTGAISPSAAAPPELHADWVFIRRAAPLSRAPAPAS